MQGYILFIQHAAHDDCYPRLLFLSITEVKLEMVIFPMRKGKSHMPVSASTEESGLMSQELFAEAC